MFYFAKANNTEAFDLPLMADPDNDNITVRAEFGYASIYCKLVNRTKLVVKTPEYMDSAEYSLKVILNDNNKY